MGMDRTSTFKAMFKEYLADVLKAEERGKKDPCEAEKRAKDGEIAKIKAKSVQLLYDRGSFPAPQL